MYSDVISLYLCLRIQHLIRVRRLVSLVYMITLPLIFIVSLRLVQVVAILFLVWSYIVYRVIRSKLEYLEFVHEFAEGWAKIEPVADNKVDVTSRGKTYRFMLCVDAGVDDSYLHVEFLERICFIHPAHLPKLIV